MMKAFGLIIVLALSLDEPIKIGFASADAPIIESDHEGLDPWTFESPSHNRGWETKGLAQSIEKANSWESALKNSDGKQNNMDDKMTQVFKIEADSELHRLGSGLDLTATELNGLPGDLQTANVTQMIPIDGGWTRFYFGGAGTETAYYISVNETAIPGNFYQVSITDAFCPGDSFDLFKDGNYLLTTPRVPSPRNPNCSAPNDDANVVFENPAYSSTKFMLPGPSFNVTIGVRDSPYGGGAGFVRVDRWIKVCTDGKFSFLTNPPSDNSDSSAACARIGKTLAHITPENVAQVVCGMQQCNVGEQAWVGRISIEKGQRDSLGCIALDASNKADPTPVVWDCDRALPVVCV